jgi:hypothetical protein
MFSYIDYIMIKNVIVNGELIPPEHNFATFHR